MIKPLDRVTFADNQLHGNLSVMVDGQVLSIEANSASILVDGEVTPRVFSVDVLSSEESAYGDGYAGSFNEQPVVNAMR
jgi:hypothetical protein